MSHRPDSARGIQVECSKDEWAVIEVLIGEGRFTSAANCIRSALWSMADERGVQMPEGCFDQRSITGPLKNLEKGRGWNRGMRKMPLLEDGKKAPQVKNRPKRNHPWREYRQSKEEYDAHNTNHDGHDDPHGQHQAVAAPKTPE